jgi:hypothetical protein
MRLARHIQDCKPMYMKRSLTFISLTLFFIPSLTPPSLASPLKKINEEVKCEIMIAGGGLAGAATAYEALLAGRTVCMTEITDWVGGQISSQGVSALDERATQRTKLFYSRGYLDLRERIAKKYNELNPGKCWVSESCFLPNDAHQILTEMLEDAAKKGKGTLKWFPSTVVKELQTIGSGSGQQIQSVIAIQHTPAPGAPKLNEKPLSANIEDFYNYQNSDKFTKKIIRFSALKSPKNEINERPADWYVIDATETGELVALAGVPYKLGIDARSHLEPSASSDRDDPYCTQGFTYTFAMEATAEPQQHKIPSFYKQYEPYYSYELKRLASFPLVFTYRRILNPTPGKEVEFNSVKFTEPMPGDISMQNWTWGNDYRPGNKNDNLVLTQDQLAATGQLKPGGWKGGLRTETLRQGELHSIAYFYWLVAGTTDSQLGDGVKQLHPNNILLKGLDSPMGTSHGLSKYPYIREGRRIIGRPGMGHSRGFMVSEIDISRRNYLDDDYYSKTLPPDMYRRLLTSLSGLEVVKILRGKVAANAVKRRSRSTIYPDSVGIAHYAIDFHPCMTQSPSEAPKNTERPGERRGAGQAYPFQVPLRSMIPQKIDNMLVIGKSIATSHIAAAAYRVHAFEWSSGAAAGITLDFAFKQGILPYQLVDEIPRRELQLEALKKRLEETNNPTAFPNTSLFNNNWADWK